GGREHIPDGLFENTGVRRVHIPQGVQTIGERAFAGFLGTEINLPMSVASIGNNAFLNARNLRVIDMTNIFLASHVRAFNATAFSGVNRASVALVVQQGLRQSFLDRGWTGFNFMFVQNSSVVGFESNRYFDGMLTLPQNIIAISANAFAMQTNFWSISIPESVEVIASTAFSGWMGTRTIYVVGRDYAPSGFAGGWSSNARVVFGVWDGSVATEFSGGDGTAQNPYQIGRASEFARLARLWNNSNHWRSRRVHLVLTRDIYLNANISRYFSWGTNAPANIWTAIGTAGNHFVGNFDGRGHSVRGVFIDESVSTQGVFGAINDSTVSNLMVENGFIRGNTEIGGIVGRIDNRSRLVNVFNSAVIFSNHGVVGGIAGRVVDSSVVNSFNWGDVTGGGLDVGGIVGVANFNSVIMNNYNGGLIGGGNSFVGGIVGWTSGANIRVEFNYFVKTASINANRNFVGGGSFVGGANNRTFDLNGTLRNQAGNANQPINIGGNRTNLLSALNATMRQNYLPLLPSGTRYATWVWENSPVPILRFEDSFSGGTGSAIDPFLVSDARNFNNIRYYYDAYFRLTNDINLVDFQNWTPIPMFRGSLNGGWHVIRGLRIQNASVYNSAVGVNAGLVAVNYGSIANLHIEAAQFHFFHNYTGTRNNVGTIAGVNRGRISYMGIWWGNFQINRPMSVTGGVVGLNDTTGVVRGVNVLHTSFSGTGDIGGVAGVNRGTIEHSTLQNGSTISHFLRRSSSIGGIAGVLENGTIMHSNVLDSTIQNIGQYASMNYAPSMGLVVGTMVNGHIISIGANNSQLLAGSLMGEQGTEQRRYFGTTWWPDWPWAGRVLSAHTIMNLPLNTITM
ncbi:MAG: leucine-rich repeat domain-containing protein, partial [Firmicutes bacterium]|nr:leucine-rich repeat domain-containing protein [Bacillota bacterium]